MYEKIIVFYFRLYIIFLILKSKIYIRKSVKRLNI